MKRKEQVLFTIRKNDYFYHQKQLFKISPQPCRWFQSFLLIGHDDASCFITMVSHFLHLKQVDSRLNFSKALPIKVWLMCLCIINTLESKRFLTAAFLNMQTLIHVYLKD